MALSVNLADIWKLFKDSKKNEKERIANWLDAVAHEASLMAAIWTETYQRVSEGAFGDKEMGAIESKLGLDRNIAPNERLRMFYKTASTVIGGKVEHDFRVDFSKAIGTMLVNRDDAIKIYEIILSRFNGMRFFVDDDNKPKDMHDFKSVIEIINREAAALEVLAKNFRASK